MTYKPQHHLDTFIFMLSPLGALPLYSSPRKKRLIGLFVHYARGDALSLPWNTLPETVSCLISTYVSELWLKVSDMQLGILCHSQKSHPCKSGIPPGHWLVCCLLHFRPSFLPIAWEGSRERSKCLIPCSLRKKTQMNVLILTMPQHWPM